MNNVFGTHLNVPIQDDHLQLTVEKIAAELAIAVLSTITVMMVVPIVEGFANVLVAQCHSSSEPQKPLDLHPLQTWQYHPLCSHFCQIARSDPHQKQRHEM